MSEACSLLSLDELLFAVDGSLFALPGLMADAPASPDVLGASDVPKKEQSLQFCFTSVSTDSRAIEKNTLFVPLICRRSRSKRCFRYFGAKLFSFVV